MTSEPSSQSLHLIEANLNIEKLISEVEDHPALWDMTQNDYNDRLKRKQSWENITEAFALGRDLSLDEKKKLGDILHKKWKNVRDRFARDLQERKGKSGNGARKKPPYMYAQQLDFLKDTVNPKRTVSSLERKTNGSTSVQEEREENGHEGEEEVTSGPSNPSSRPNVLRAPVTKVGKKRLHPIEEKILRSLDNYEKRTKTGQAKEISEDDDNRHFLLSMLKNLSSLPQHLNTSCRIELMQCINKYQIMNQQYNPQHQFQQPHHSQSVQHPPMYSNQDQSQVLPTRKVLIPRSTVSPAESATSYVSHFTDEDQSSDIFEN